MGEELATTMRHKGMLLGLELPFIVCLAMSLPDASEEPPLGPLAVVLVHTGGVDAMSVLFAILPLAHIFASIRNSKAAATVMRSVAELALIEISLLRQLLEQATLK